MAKKIHHKLAIVTPLARFENRLQIIRDRAAGVALGMARGLYLSGPPGLGKSRTVRDAFVSNGVSAVIQNGHITPAALFALLSEHPTGHIVLDDVAELFNQPKALQLLLAATDGTGEKERNINYRNSRGLQSVEFRGSITCISNLPLRCDPLGQALRSRMVILEHAPPDEEVFAYMEWLASKPSPELTVDDQTKVVQFIIGQCQSRDIRPNLRLIERGYSDFRLAKSGKSVTSWKELIRSSMHPDTPISRMPMSRNEKKDQQRELVRDLLARFPDDLESQLAKWPMSRAQFFAVRREVQTNQIDAVKELPPPSPKIQKSRINDLD